MFDMEKYMYINQILFPMCLSLSLHYDKEICLLPLIAYDGNVSGQPSVLTQKTKIER